MQAELNPVLLKGRIIEASERDVKIELQGRMGIIILPKRSVITDKPLQNGDEAKISISYAQVL